jgi:hypothetical protein
LLRVQCSLDEVVRLRVMTVENTPPGRGGAVPRTVQEYIDETPMWADSTAVRYSPMTNMQWLIWGLAAAGKFFEGMVVFTTGVALPLMGQEFALGATEKGVVAVASLFGILIGATALGGLPTDTAARRCSSSRWCCSPSSSWSSPSARRFWSWSWLLSASALRSDATIRPRI